MSKTRPALQPSWRARGLASLSAAWLLAGVAAAQDAPAEAPPATAAPQSPGADAAPEEPSPSEAPAADAPSAAAAPSAEQAAAAEVPVDAAPVKSTPPDPVPELVVEPVEDEPGFKPHVDFGAGLRNQTSLIAGDEGGFTGATFAPADGGVVMNDVSIRPYILGELHERVAFEANLDAWAAVPGGNAGVVILDAVMKFDLAEAFQVWVGRFATPSDRANLSGRYFQNAWLYPLEMGYRRRSIYAGRDNGLAFWGQVGGGRFRYQVGMFNLDGGSVRPAARVVLNVLDVESEAPSYYNRSTYYGKAGTILAIGASAQFEKDGVPGLDTDGDGVPDREPDDYTPLQADVLFELPVGGDGALDLEAALYVYNADDIRVMGLASFLFAGMVQPSVRVMVTPLGGDADASTHIDAGVNLVLDGHNLRLSLVERIDINGNAPLSGTPDSTTFATILGLQGQVWP